MKKLSSYLCPCPLFLSEQGFGKSINYDNRLAHKMYHVQSQLWCVLAHCFSLSKNTTRKPVGFMQSCFCAGVHVVTSTTHGVHMDTTWHPCGNPAVSCRNHIVYTFETLCCPPGNQMVSTMKPHGVHMETT